MTNVMIENSLDYQFVQMLGWDYNFWTMIFADIVLAIAFFGIIFVVGFIGFWFDWW